MKSFLQEQSFPPAFTLLELLLAAAISTLVLAGISSLIFILYQVQSTSSDSVRLMETGRNLVRQLEWDLHSIHGEYPVEESSDSTSGEGTVLALDLDSESLLMFDESAASTVPSYYLIGDASSLEFLASPLSRTGSTYHVAADPSVETELEQYQLRLVTWGVSDQESMGLLLEDVDPTHPIVRAVAITDAEILLTDWTDAWALPEVVEIQFSYYDGESWLDSWNSDETGALPKAIEVSLTLQSTNPTSQPEKVLTRTISIPAQRFVTTTSVEESS